MGSKRSDVTRKQPRRGGNSGSNSGQPAIGGESVHPAPPGEPSPPETRVPIATLAPDPRNPRQMGDAARAGLAVSLKTFGPLDIVFNLQTGELVRGSRQAEHRQPGGEQP